MTLDQFKLCVKQRQGWSDLYYWKFIGPTDMFKIEITKLQMHNSFHSEIHAKDHLNFLLDHGIDIVYDDIDIPEFST